MPSDEKDTCLVHWATMQTKQLFPSAQPMSRGRRAPTAGWSEARKSWDKREPPGSLAAQTSIIRQTSRGGLCALALCCGSVVQAAETPVTPAVAPAEPPTAARAEGTAATRDLTQPPAGHSLHGESFNAGPRQTAYLMEGTGKIEFPITTSDPRAQQFFAQGVGQLHGFWYFEAERAFRQVLAIDADCAMAYWGLALANRENAERAKAFIREAVARKDKVSAREGMWIDSLDHLLNPPDKQQKSETWRRLIRDLEAIVHAQPDDVEPKAFLAWAIWQASREGLPINSHEAANAILQQAIALQPDHAGVHHYTVHLWDEEKAERAIWAAAGIGPAAPGIAHMWHMAGHTYDKLHRYADSAWQQEASARVDHAYMQRDRVMPYLIHNYAHNQEWCVRTTSAARRVSVVRGCASCWCVMSCGSTRWPWLRRPISIRPTRFRSRRSDCT
jgi:tetratricopeptide (TPR) repeat protein